VRESSIELEIERGGGEEEEGDVCEASESVRVRKSERTSSSEEEEEVQGREDVSRGRVLRAAASP
jgi:hypothetical protein